MPWWGWLIIVVVAAICVPIKLKLMKKMLTKKDREEPEDF